MQHLHIWGKRTTAWPWVAGLVVLVLVGWGVTTLLAAPEEEADQVVETAADTLPPAAIPAPPKPVQVERIARVEELAPLDVGKAGQRVRAGGEVVATGTTGFWLVAGAHVLRVDSDRTVRKGQTVTVDGVLEPMDDADRTDRIAAEVLDRDPRSEAWEVVRSVRLVEEAEPTA